MMPIGHKGWHQHCSNVDRALSNFLKCFCQIPFCLVGGIAVSFQLLSGSHELWITTRVKSQQCLFIYICLLSLFYSPESCNLESLSFGINRQFHSDMANTANKPLGILISVSLFPEIDTNTLNYCLWVFFCFAACILLLMQNWSCRYLLRPNLCSLPGDQIYSKISQKIKSSSVLIRAKTIKIRSSACPPPSNMRTHKIFQPLPCRSANSCSFHENHQSRKTKTHQRILQMLPAPEEELTPDYNVKKVEEFPLQKDWGQNKFSSKDAC